MHCIVTAGATWEPIDQVRRLTNFSTGSLGTSLARHFASAGHSVELLLSDAAPAPSDLPGASLTVTRFSTTSSLEALFQSRCTSNPVALFHAAAVSDFQVAGSHERRSDGSFVPLSAGKLSTRDGRLWIELSPTPKILPKLRGWYPAARIIGWKYETDGTRADVLARVARQFSESRNDACVANGPAYGDGFGLVRPDGSVLDLADRPALLDALLHDLNRFAASSPSSPPRSGH